MYDLLFSENLSKQDIRAIKKISVELLAKVKAKIAELDHWWDKWKPDLLWMRSLEIRSGRSCRPLMIIIAGTVQTENIQMRPHTLPVCGVI